MEEYQKVKTSDVTNMNAYLLLLAVPMKDEPFPGLLVILSALSYKVSQCRGNILPDMRCLFVKVRSPQTLPLTRSKPLHYLEYALPTKMRRQQLLYSTQRRQP
jgi:hypothetical protein